MNLSMFILKGCKVGEKNNSSVNIRFASKTSDISFCELCALHSCCFCFCDA